MIPILIGVALGPFVGVIDFLHQKYVRIRWPEFPIGMAFWVSFVGAGVGLAVAIIIGNTGIPAHMVTVEEYKLVSLERTSGVQGSPAFLGMGNFQSQPYYFYYIATEDGGFQPGQLAANGWATITIYEDSTQETARLEVKDKRNLYVRSFWWGFTFETGCASYRLPREFHIPRGSLEPHFNP